jgi:DNA-binding transcriptional LysR family regulator
LNNGRKFDWDDLRYFLAVAREGSTIAAAKVLGVSQPTVQRRLAVFQDRLGRRLFESLPSGYRLTGAGQDLLPQAERVEQEIAAFERHLRATEELRGTIRVTCPEADFDRLLAPVLERFRAGHPGIAIEFVVSDRPLDLAKGEADVALRGGAVRDQNLIGLKLADVPWFVFGSHSYMARNGAPAGTAELNHHAIIVYVGAIAELKPAQWLRATAPHARIAGSSGSVLGALAAAKAGSGLAILPALVGQADRNLACVLKPDPEATEPFTLLVHPDLRENRRVRAFMDFVAAEKRLMRALLRGEVTEAEDLNAG